MPIVSTWQLLLLQEYCLPLKFASSCRPTIIKISFEVTLIVQYKIH